MEPVDRRKSGRHTGWVDGFILAAIIAFLLSYFRPELLLSPTITTGGDTASHYSTAQYLRDVLLPQGRISGWFMGNYAGFPLLQSYFPLPFLGMALLSWFVPLQVAFKLVTVSGIFLLPLAAYSALRLMGRPFPAPILAALFTLPFLFMEDNSVWGGNIFSTLAGEFSYSISLAFTVLFMGTLYRGITTDRWVILNGFMVFLIGFSHGYTLLFAGLMSSCFVFDPRYSVRNFLYLVRVHGLGILLMGFWLVPLLGATPWTTPYADRWLIESVLEVVPPLLWPGILFALLGLLVWHIKPLQFMLYGMLAALFFYLTAPLMGLVDIRFLPFLQLLLMFSGAMGLALLTASLRLKVLIPFIALLLVLPGVQYYQINMSSWIPWNYSGFEAKPLWEPFKETNSLLKGTQADPRVVYEHSPRHNSAGTIRAFESLPFFAGRSTLEGLYMQASVSAPFVFYLQSELSAEPSRPFPQYPYSSMDLAAGIEHLRLFNVRDVVVITDTLRKQLQEHPHFTPVAQVSPYSIYRLTSNENRYVTPLRYRPIHRPLDHWKRESFDWFRALADHPEVHLVFADEKPIGAIGGDKLQPKQALPRVPLDVEPVVTETIGQDEIHITTSHPGLPLLVKVSYHPGWQVEGAEAVYLASPSFMLVYPTQKEVRLYFGGTGWNTLGWILSSAGWLLVIAVLVLRRTPWGKTTAERLALTTFVRAAQNRRVALEQWSRSFLLLMTALTLCGAVTLIALSRDDPALLINQWIILKDEGQMQEARTLFKRIVEDYPDFGRVDEAAYYYGICYYLEADCASALPAFEDLIAAWPESPWVVDARLHIDRCSQE